MSDLLKYKWCVGRNRDDQFNVYCNNISMADVTPASDDMGTMSDEVCQHIVDLHNSWLENQNAAPGGTTGISEDGETFDFIPDRSCLHGNFPGDCNACDRLSDEGFDMDREQRFFGR